MIPAPADLDHHHASAAALTVAGNTHPAANRTRSAWEARAGLRDARARAGLCVECGDPAHWTLCGDCETNARRDLERY